MKIIELPNGTLAQVAEYKEQEIFEYMGNPLIESLPLIYSQQEVIESLAVYPPYHKEERFLEDYKRVHFIQRLQHYFQPLPIHLSVQSSIDRLLRAGYVARNPLAKEYAKGFTESWGYIQNGSIDSSVLQTGQTLSIFGISGVGKTRTLGRIIEKTIPQVISHTSYKNTPLNLYQVNYLKIQTPFDGSVKTIIYDFMYQYDLLMGTNYFNRYANSRLSTSQLMPITAQILKGVGCIIIDEVQNLREVKSKSSAQVLNFFTTLINTINIPLIMIGTPKAMDVMQAQFRQARRNTNAGNIMWNRMEKDEVWELFMQGLWKYQWTKKIVLYDAEISSLMYDVSQGIPDICIKTFMMVQLRCISSGDEEITLDKIRKIANEELKLVQPMLQALRNNNYGQLSKYDDLVFPDIRGFIEGERVVINQKQVMDSLAMGVERQNDKSKLIDDAVFRLGILGIDDGVARKTLSDILEVEGSNRELSTLVQIVYKAVTNEAKEEILEIYDFREILKEGKTNNKSAYQALVEAGAIVRDYPLGVTS